LVQWNRDASGIGIDAFKPLRRAKHEVVRRKARRTAATSDVKRPELGFNAPPVSHVDGTINPLVPRVGPATPDQAPDHLECLVIAQVAEILKWPIFSRVIVGYVGRDIDQTSPQCIGWTVGDSDFAWNRAIASWSGVMDGSE